MMTGFENEENEKEKDYEELTNMNEEMESMRMGGSCAVSSAASTGCGLGWGTFARRTELERELDAEDN